MKKLLINLSMYQRLIILLFFLMILPSLLSAKEVLYYVCDINGTPVAMTNEKGNVVWRGSALPFGEDFGGTGTRDTEIGYCGKPYNPNIGLYDLGARYYDPHTGRFTSVDPVMGDIQNPQRLNSYAYGLNSPYKYVDPNGQEAIALSILTVVTVGTIIAYESTPGVMQGQVDTIKGVAGEVAASARDASSWIGVNTRKLINKLRSQSASKDINLAKEAKREGSKIKEGKELTPEEAAERVGKGEDVAAGSQEEAERIAREAGGGKDPVGPENHGLDKRTGGQKNGDWRDHYHPHGHGKGHVFF